MGHNYAKPATPAQRLERVLGRVPEDWEVQIERGAGSWRALVRPAGTEGTWSETSMTMVEALESAWRLNRPPSS
ncbi:hypothetical protein [Acetobacter conturbans]|uniref:Uncharacterized protein n=1 Tax=Acetobacter conturbans TaxID=1737472 RepID=A0ABX0K1F2_9PROT|nr:hypothetical protein [Acetobacter conturbans]NHN88528.1 hypothetical protein [Acetobacter conturbans]